MGGYYQEMKFDLPNETHVEFWVVARCIYNRRRNSINNNRRRNSVTASTHDNDNEVELAVLISASSSAPPPDHVGVYPCVRQRIPQTTYKSCSTSFSVQPFHEEMCALWQYDFMDGDSVSIIPHCSHSFHSSCISSHMDYSKGCPCCRCVITVDLAPLEHDDDANYQHCPVIEE
ncbi:RING-H2 finger protein ATL28-like [Ziziphus jujuba]|uniref:RING-type E3 ubiquitin transferase n=1 Tax=Ziziphus jujuba TaxID=326968 RepID=A0ABM3ZUL7_ZIZJJ|nr:RING-H2 finger protein ATL28-like [Ziziphus jujuba]